jgi:hypothetical protein
MAAELLSRPATRELARSGHVEPYKAGYGASPEETTMRNNHWFSSAAIALTFGAAGLLNAAMADTNKPNPEPAPAAQQNAPPAKIAPSIHAGERRAPVKPENSGQAAAPEPGHVKADEKTKADMPASNSSATAADKSGAGIKASESSKPSPTTGQGAAAGSAKPSSEQRGKISALIKKQNVQPVHVNFSINVGTRVPPTVHDYPLPLEVVTIYPEWRGYDYILVGDQIVVIDPDTHEVVAILDA